MNKIQTLFLTIIVVCAACFMGTVQVAAENMADQVNQPLADVKIGANGIGWMPKVEYAQLILTVSSPDGSVFSKTFEAGISPYLELSGDFIDGSYTYELRMTPVGVKRARGAAGENAGLLPQKTLAQSGSFLIQGGKFVTAEAPAEGIARPKDVLHYDDVIITGSLCVGFDCADGESFGFDTIILKEHNLRIYFNDTSYTASYPTNSWRITINDSTNGGASYFSIDDVDDGTSIFKVEAGAPSNSLYVEDYGRVGLGTSTPVVELHIKDSDTPTLRLEQDSSGGWTAQTFDVAGNESNFFIRDATNGSKLPFRIQPSTPSSTLCLKSDGKVGIGTWSPAYLLELEATGETAVFALERTDGATAKIVGGGSAVQFGSISDHDVKIITHDSDTVAIFETTGDVSIGSTSPSYKLQVWNDAETAYGYSDGGSWQTGSSKAFKEHIKELTANEAIAAFEALRPIRYYYKGMQDEEHLGFIAEDVPEIVANSKRDAISAMDIATLLTKVVQEQQKSMLEQQKTITVLKEEIAELKKKIER